MEKAIRKATRCYLIKDNKIAVTKYKKGNKKEGYYEIPGGKIEDGELAEQTVIREMKEETGLNIINPKNKGNIIIEYPDRIIDFDVFIAKDYNGELQENEDNISEWIEINELLQKEKILSSIIVLERFFIKGLLDENYNFRMHIKVDEDESIFNIDYSLLKK